MSGIWIELSDRVVASDGVADARSQCSFCRRGLARLERLIAAADVSICSACVQECARRLRRRNVLGWRRWWRFWEDGEPSKTRTGLSYRDPHLACSFCKRSLVEVPALLGDGRVNICSPCVGLCMEILREEPR
ncbi:ClpX C4-type zinc finger protein [Sorangium sp. So ce128]|uniref:ClpX C4-type zinc finger protein n=1 Tax=Sorangium sp. So ce128 TaxID=3133281 RepID=UPI003F5D6DC6